MPIEKKPKKKISIWKGRYTRLKVKHETLEAEVIQLRVGVDKLIKTFKQLEKNANISIERKQPAYRVW